MNELIYIIIPAYNVGRYITECINSVKNQTYNNIEIIIINDGSCDNTKEIIQNIAISDCRIKIVNNLNKGVSATRNEGIELAKGDWIVFIDGDDYIAEDYLEHMLEIANITHADFCMTTDCYKNPREKQSSPIVIKQYNQDDATSLLLSTKVEVGCWNKMFRRNLLIDKNVRFNTNLFYGEGLCFITTLSQLSNCVGISNKKIYYYRQNNTDSATKHFDVEKIVNGWEALNQIEDHLALNMPKSKKTIEQHRFLFSWVAVQKIVNSDTEKQHVELYKFHLANLRHNLVKQLQNPSIEINYKIKIIVCAIFPKLTSYYKKYIKR